MKYYFLLFAILLTSCSLNMGHSIDINDSETQIIELPNLSDSVNFYYSNVFSDVNHVVLESGPESSFGFLSQLEIINSGDYIIFDKSNKKILRFDSCGVFLNQIGQRGNGRNEYVDPLNMSYDRFNDKILISDCARHNLLVYNIDGSVEKVVKIDEFYNSLFCVLDSCHLLFYSNYMSEDGYNYHITDYEGNVISRFENKFDSKVFKGYPDCSGVFSYGNNDVWSRSLFSSKIYSITDSIVSLKYELVDINGHWSVSDPRSIKNVIKKPIELVKVGIVNNSVFIACVNNGKWYSYYNDLMGPKYAGIYSINDVKGFVGTADFSLIPRIRSIVH